ncbi:hypothetical protein ACMHYB_39515 [Sorangium sp. So ce1128]
MASDLALQDLEAGPLAELVPQGIDAALALVDISQDVPRVLQGLDAGSSGA